MLEWLKKRRGWKRTLRIGSTWPTVQGLWWQNLWGRYRQGHVQPPLIPTSAVFLRIKTQRSVRDGCQSLNCSPKADVSSDKTCTGSFSWRLIAGPRHKSKGDKRWPLIKHVQLCLWLAANYERSTIRSGWRSVISSFHGQQRVLSFLLLPT